MLESTLTANHVIACILFIRTESMHMSAVVTHDMMLDIGMDMDTLFDECKSNSKKMYPGKVIGISEYLGKGDMEIEPDGIVMPQVYVLTNAAGVGGAAAFFYQPDMVDNLATMLGKDLLVFPAGKNEMFCIPVSNSTQIGEIQEMYNEAVTSLGLDEEQPLSAEVMQYDHIKRNVRQMLMKVIGLNFYWTDWTLMQSKGVLRTIHLKHKEVSLYRL